MAVIFGAIWVLALVSWFYSAYAAFRARKFFRRPLPPLRGGPFARFKPSNYDTGGKQYAGRARAAMVLFMALVATGFVVMSLAIYMERSRAI